MISKSTVPVIKSPSVGLATPYRGRFAPTPNGPMHPGTAAAALMAASHAQAHGGWLWLRWDDLDRARCRPEWVASLREDLAWLGLRFDGEVFESSLTDTYQAALAELAQTVGLYACGCSRSAIRQRTGRSDLYDGHCRGRRVLASQLPDWLADPPRGLALRLDSDSVGPQQGATGFADGDPLLWTVDGHASYSLACAVDELTLGTTHVVRGADLAPQTALQTALMLALGTPRDRLPQYVHFPLVLDATGRKHSKSAGAAGLRTQGLTAEEFRDWLGRSYFEPPVGGHQLWQGWSGRLRSEPQPWSRLP